MVRLTLIARVADGLPLAEGLDSDKEHDLDVYKSQAKPGSWTNCTFLVTEDKLTSNEVQTLFKKMSQTGPQASRMSVDSGPFAFHYMIEGGVCYLTLADKGYPKKLAYQYLEDLQREFAKLYSSQVDTAARPYAFIKFDTFIQKTKKQYADSRTQRNIENLNDDLTEVHSIMTKNIQDVLGQGERLDRMAQMSATLTSESKQYADRAKDLYHQALIRKYMPIAAVAAVILLVLWLRHVFYS